jgi:DNA polymerase
MSKTVQLDELYNSYKEEFGLKEIVFGDGNKNANIMLIGEAPGKDEVKLLKPFVGAAGKNLNEFIRLLEIDREDLYITNAIKYRLSKLNPITNRIINRPAEKKEIELNKKYLYKEIEIISPKYIVTLGNVPLRAIINDSRKVIGELHGRELNILINGFSFILFPLYHPASIIYNKNLKELYINDINEFKKIINCNN